MDKVIYRQNGGQMKRYRTSQFQKKGSTYSVYNSPRDGIYIERTDTLPFNNQDSGPNLREWLYDDGMIRRLRYKNVSENVNPEKYVKKTLPTDTLYQAGPMTIINSKNRHHWINTISQFK